MDCGQKTSVLPGWPRVYWLSRPPLDGGCRALSLQSSSSEPTVLRCLLIRNTASRLYLEGLTPCLETKPKLNVVVSGTDVYFLTCPEFIFFPQYVPLVIDFLRPFQSYRHSTNAPGLSVLWQPPCLFLHHLLCTILERTIPSASYIYELIQSLQQPDKVTMNTGIL